MHTHTNTGDGLGFKYITGQSPQAANDSRGGRGVKTDKAIATGAVIPFMLAGAAGDFVSARERAGTMFGKDSSTYAILKQAVGAGNTANEGWAGALVDWKNEADEFITWLRPQHLLGKFGTRGVPDLRQVDFFTSIPRQTSGGQAKFVKEGHAIGLTKFSLDRITLAPLKAATISVISRELALFSKPNAATIVRDEIGAAINECLDRAFVDPTNAGEDGVSPASITYGIAATPSTGGSDGDSIREDIKRLIGRHLAGNNPPMSGVWIISSFAALALSLMRNPLGQPEFEGLILNGGHLAGLPCIVSCCRFGEHAVRLACSS